MRMAKNILIALAASSAVLAPAAASATSAASGARASSAISGESELAGNSGWIIGLVGLLAGITAIVLISEDDEDSPVSP